MYTSRDYQSDLDLRAMQDVVIACWAADGPHVPVHVGDLAWWRYQHMGREQEWRIRLWAAGVPNEAACAWPCETGRSVAAASETTPRAEMVITGREGWMRGSGSTGGSPRLCEVGHFFNAPPYRSSCPERGEK